MIGLDISPIFSFSISVKILSDKDFEFIQPNSPPSSEV